MAASADPIRVRAELVGFDETVAKVKAMGVGADEIALAGLMAGGELIRHEAVNNIDEHGLRISGTLARSLHTEEATGGRTHS